jgi:hypothetical protein
MADSPQSHSDPEEEKMREIGRGVGYLCSFAM